MSFDNNRQSDVSRGSEQADVPKLDRLMGGGVGDSASALKSLEEMRKSISRPTDLGFAPVSIDNGQQACAT